MTRTREASVVPLTPRSAAAGRSRRLHPALGALDPALTLVRDWPERVAVAVGRAGFPTVSTAVSAAGFELVVMSPAQANALLPALGPVSFFMLGADVFADDGAVETVRAWHRCSPAARLKLVYPRQGRDPDVVVRAVRAGVTDVLDPEDARGVVDSLGQALVAAGAVRERVLAVGAHPDDVEIGCAGTLLDHRRRGDRVSILTLSRGAVGGDTDSRETEAAATADELGAQLIMGDLPDTAIDEGIATIRLIENVVRALDPTVVYVHSANDNHQDHRAVNIATRSATRGVRRVFAYQSPSATNAFLPTQFVKIDETVGDKVRILQMFGSQEGRSYLEPELVLAGARYWARHLAANARYAEPFEVIRSVGELRHSTTAPVYDLEPLLAGSPESVEAARSAVDSRTMFPAVESVPSGRPALRTVNARSS